MMTDSAKYRSSIGSRASNGKRILIVNCYFDSVSRRGVPRPHMVPKPMAPVYLAGAFSRELCDVRLHCEVASGPLIDPNVLAWPDVLVLTGLTTSLDRMKHLTAYARTLNENVIVVAGGPAIRALPRYCRRFFDYCCAGDVEQIREVITDALGDSYLSEEMFPRYDLAYWLGRIGEVESSRNCNFRCKFCSLTGEAERTSDTISSTSAGKFWRRESETLFFSSTIIFMETIALSSLIGLSSCATCAAREQSGAGPPW